MIRATKTKLNGVSGFFMPEDDFISMMQQWQEVENLFARVDQRPPKQVVQAVLTEAKS